jgi:hypothetical protein
VPERALKVPERALTDPEPSNESGLSEHSFKRGMFDMLSGTLRASGSGNSGTHSRPTPTTETSDGRVPESKLDCDREQMSTS